MFTTLFPTRYITRTGCVGREKQQAQKRHREKMGSARMRVLISG
jgi:hypothetical protein